MTTYFAEPTDLKVLTRLPFWDDIGMMAYSISSGHVQEQEMDCPMHWPTSVLVVVVDELSISTSFQYLLFYFGILKHM